MKLWTGVVTENVRASRDFYIKVFGCEVIYEGEGGWFVLLGLGSSELAFMKPGLESQAEIFRTPFSGQGVWVTVDVEDVDEHYARVRSLGIPIDVVLRDEPWGDRHFAIIDPNGMAVDVVQRRVP